MPRPRFLVCALAALALTAVAACGDDDDDTDRTSDRRADQVRDAVDEAGLPEDVGEVLALAARAPTATFQVTYPGSDGSRIVVYQDPPNRRVDVITGGQVVESRLLRDSVSYLCQPSAGSGGGSPLACQRDAGALSAPGAFSSEALDQFIASLAGTDDTLELTVEERTIADETARCLITAPKGGTPLDGTGPTVDTLCVSPEGAQLLVDVDGDRVVASAYSTDIPDGTFDLDATADGGPAPTGDAS